MKIERIDSQPPFREQDFTFPDSTVQGAFVAKKKNAIFVRSRSRYKLECDGVHIVYADGTGHIKWKRGEFPFSAGDALRLEKTGEYEINGKGNYLIIFEK